MSAPYRPSILPEPFECPDCGVECEAVVTFDPRMQEHVDAWWCPTCEAKFYREVGGEVNFRGVASRLGSRLLSPFRRGKN
jgi:transcription elongation factor Elf1